MATSAETPFEVTMREVAALEAQYVFEVLGNSGRTYEVPKEVWDHIPSSYKRLLVRDKGVK